MGFDSDCSTTRDGLDGLDRNSSRTDIVACVNPIDRGSDYTIESVDTSPAAAVAAANPAPVPADDHSTALDSLPAGSSNRNWSRSQESTTSIDDGIAETPMLTPASVPGGDGASANTTAWHFHQDDRHGTVLVVRHTQHLCHSEEYRFEQPTKPHDPPGGARISNSQRKVDRGYLPHVKIKKHTTSTDKSLLSNAPLSSRLPNKTLLVPHQVSKGSKARTKQRHRSTTATASVPLVPSASSPLALAVQSGLTVEEVDQADPTSVPKTKRLPTLAELFDGDLTDVSDDEEGNHDSNRLDVSTRPGLTDPPPEATEPEYFASRYASPDTPLATICRPTAQPNPNVDTTAALKRQAPIILTSMQTSHMPPPSPPSKKAIIPARREPSMSLPCAPTTPRAFAAFIPAPDTSTPTAMELDVSILAALYIDVRMMEHTSPDSTCRQGIFTFTNANQRSHSS